MGCRSRLESTVPWQNRHHVFWTRRRHHATRKVSQMRSHTCRLPEGAEANHNTTLPTANTRCSIHHGHPLRLRLDVRPRLLQQRAPPPADRLAQSPRTKRILGQRKTHPKFPPPSPRLPRHSQQNPEAGPKDEIHTPARSRTSQQRQNRSHVPPLPPPPPRTPRHHLDHRRRPNRHVPPLPPPHLRLPRPTHIRELLPAAQIPHHPLRHAARL